ncbi:NnrT protein [Maritimibacter sp. UBA3975]|uniref:NnrT protein n=1 Tax=Maritimibacter sp. UBA3975 TaxID=1946833 RepID=UPI000C09F5D6|nr:NnrT protein [Maritimibacter sp. UBA3975]MAM59930.1 NnrT protein [Maritimibacter sp.]|tara:strand:+ start:28262 stop:28483 length:222 start_codon:yes stop_codon:yes gene_type:complete
MTARGFVKLNVALYPFGAGAVAVNLFFASLIGSWLGWRVLTPQEAVAWGMFLGLPVTWAFARHIRALIARAEA